MAILHVLEPKSEKFSGGKCSGEVSDGLPDLPNTYISTTLSSWAPGSYGFTQIHQ